MKSNGLHKTYKAVPRKLILYFLFSAFLQLICHHYYGQLQAHAKRLPPPLSSASYQLLNLGEDTASAYLLSIWLQSFDNQPGLRLPYSALDYATVARWLSLIESLNSESNYPQLLAAYSYASLPNTEQQRIMLRYIHRSFKLDPVKNWRWLAQAALIAKHDLNDLPLALEYAMELHQLAQKNEIPYWVRDLPIIYLEDMGNYQAARILIGGLLAHGEISDRFELAYLQQKFDALSPKK